MISSWKNNIANTSPLMSPLPKKVMYELTAQNIYYSKVDCHAELTHGAASKAMPHNTDPAILHPL